MRNPVTRLLAMIAIELAAVGALSEHGAQSQGIGPGVFGPLIEACEMDRSPLQTRIIVQSSLAGADAEWTEGGWVALDDDSGEVLLLDETVELTERWAVGRSGIGRASPLIVGGRTTGFINEEGLTLTGGRGPYPIFGEADHAVAADMNQVIYASGGSIFTLDLSSSGPKRLYTSQDFGISVDETKGLPPDGLVRRGGDGALYVAWRAQSSIWRLEENGLPMMVVQRCVPEALRRTHLDAPLIDLGHLGFTEEVSISVSSISDFVVLNSGDVLVLGELKVGPVPVPVSWTSGRPKHQAAFLLSFSRARAGVMYPCRCRSQPLL